MTQLPVHNYDKAGKVDLRTIETVSERKIRPIIKMTMQPLIEVYECTRMVKLWMIGSIGY